MSKAIKPSTSRPLWRARIAHRADGDRRAPGGVEHSSGVALTRDCQAALKQAELRVQALTESSSGLELEPLDEEDLELDDDDRG
jgi:hypothetical protein